MDDLAFRDLLEQAISGDQDAKLVLADRLQEKEDPRGELIALEHILQNSNGNSVRVKKQRNKLKKIVEEGLAAKFPNFKILGHWNGFPADIIISPEEYDQFNQSEDASSNIKVRFSKKYNVVAGNIYAQAIHSLRRILEEEANQKHPRFKFDEKTSIYRPLTLAETVEAQIVNYWTLKNPDGSLRTEEERLNVFNTWLDSCTGIAYQAGTRNFKIDPECRKLIAINENFRGIYFPIDYAENPGEELDLDGGIYDQQLTKPEFLVHPFYDLVIPDKTLRREFGELVYAKRDNSPSLGIYLLNGIDEDQLRALYVSRLDVGSDVVGRCSVGGGTRFLQIAQGSRHNSSRPKLYK